ncbi:MAG: DEAD/DEAH box helicase [Burkholderiales bacterium]|nr:DEAD/DEAH box helicase [Burkholderiales bacterium]
MSQKDRIAALEAECAKLRAENALLRAAVQDRSGRPVDIVPPQPRPTKGADISVRHDSPTSEKVALFRSLFRGRDDIYPLRWESKAGRSGYSPACANEWVSGVCEKPRIKCSDCANKAFLAVSDDAVYEHLSGRRTLGVYPILRDDTCWFVAADFDGTSWREDATAYASACRELGVPASLEISRSGEGAHVWIFFMTAIAAGQARQLASAAITRACARHRTLAFASYDRLFPSQDTLPKGGFGNLIALPLQRKARDAGASVFVDDAWRPYPDQWAYLATIERMTPSAVESAMARAAREDGVLGVRSVTFGDDAVDDPWSSPPSVNAMLAHDIGVLCAPTAFGKTVAAAAVTAARKTNTLIIVHRTQLLDQRRNRLTAFLDVNKKTIGSIGAGKRSPTGTIDVAIMQSLVRKGVVRDIIASYGQVIVDECHHISAFSSERVMKEAKARCILGLTATPLRRDGHHPIIFMQCGPMRYRGSAAQAGDSIRHVVISRSTAFSAPAGVDKIQSLFGVLAQSEDRNNLIVQDVVAALVEGRTPLVLTERKDHLDRLSELLKAATSAELVVLSGGMGRRKQAAAIDRLSSSQGASPRVVLATGRFIGEGFDDPRLDTLFLASPISWRGTLQQYAGRLHRVHADKQDVRIYDYVDAGVPALMRMFNKRLRGYRAMGYQVADGTAGAVSSLPLDFQQNSRVARKQFLDELAAQAQEHGLGY